MASTGSFFGSNSSSTRNNESSGASRFRRANVPTAANGRARQQVGQETETNREITAPRNQGNVVISSRELGALFDGMKALTDLMKRQHNDIQRMAGSIEESRKEMSEVKEEIKEMRTELNSSHTFQHQEPSHYGPVPKALKVIISIVTLTASNKRRWWGEGICIIMRLENRKP